MDFLRRPRRLETGHSPASVDYRMFSAALQALQSSTVTARMQAHAPEEPERSEAHRCAIAELLTGGPQWQSAVEEQGGSFNVRYARRR